MPVIRNLRGRSGTSLIEVLITLVVFLTGMVYVVRMFPGGFVSLRHDENVTAANRLAQSELERLQGRAINLPSGILPWGWDGTKYAVLPVTDPEKMDDQDTRNGIPPNFDMYYHTDVNKFRRVTGEFTRIPSPITTNGVYGSIYVLQYSPVMATDKNSPSNDNPVLVAGGAMRRRWMTSSQRAPSLTSFGQYSIDYDKAILYVRPSTSPNPRVFLISYSYWMADGTLKTVMDSVGVPPVASNSTEVRQGYQAVTILDPDDPGESRPLSQVSGFESIDRASDTLSRQFEQLFSVLDFHSDDPYEFVLTDPYRGVLVFNPAGYGYDEYTARGRQPLVANITYSILDWHIIREERKLPTVLNSAADQDVKLTLRYIKESGQSEEYTGGKYRGLAYNYGLPYDVIAVDVETGAWYTYPVDPGRSTSYAPYGSGSTHPAMSVDYKGGTVRFDPDYAAIRQSNPGAVSPFAGKSFRIFYRAEGDWAVQTYKAYETYQRSINNGPNGLDHRQFDMNGSVLHVAECNAGSTVTVDFAYTVGLNPEEFFVSGRVYQINDGSDSTLPRGAANLASSLTGTHGSGAVINVTRVTKVSGVSLGVRVVWRESGRAFSAGRWRKVNLETYLTRPDS